MNEDFEDRAGGSGARGRTIQYGAEEYGAEDFGVHKTGQRERERREEPAIMRAGMQNQH